MWSCILAPIEKTYKTGCVSFEETGKKKATVGYNIVSKQYFARREVALVQIEDDWSTSKELSRILGEEKADLIDVVQC